ncbi:ferrous iron transporter B [Acinetobacter junii]|uniref:Fe(2+) transporter FeoB n=1 Tax=Acinetobacter venetianus (strain ATCC 31012 / DSM 23050 / BCRC 14357 / CCUG 45561 / CIP 110063 / KCTC 2702 / LMG 19082 / RAG-1) TaxID=1191460 RepID=N8ZZ59_ACIVR|nr:MULTISPECIES: ferrous iron transporter B [Acinetobacter]MBC9227779.1 ferrous iron transporter B [Acinetobacter baumannii]ENV36820.1 ferrous iron transporter B [Acinetobacter venetianus RAG-1 = CIP 110063]MCU4407511.1 ferrous iron transporter B [Acinetobacter junii]MDH0666894.1 ferrous iron transporter B [Acinetobacter junii]MDH1691838.1 ferrous iron transporter B [Acinetobacter junii]
METKNIALVGNPNCGKTSLFNTLTGTRQKVANYAGVTVERKEGFFKLPSGDTVRVLDLPGTYSLKPSSLDEEVTRAVCFGELKGEVIPDIFVCVVDATNLHLHLSLVLEVRALNRPMLLVLNMMDEVRKRGISIDTSKLSQLLGIPVVESIAVKTKGIQGLLTQLDQKNLFVAPYHSDLSHFDQIKYITKQVILKNDNGDKRTAFLDKMFLHPVFGLLILTFTMFVMFQAVFIWAQPLISFVEDSISWFGGAIGPLITHPLLRSLVVDGVIAGAGSVLAYMPQILILFFFILILEESGYLPRAAFLLDKLMSKAGLSGRSFIPLLSSFACAIPGVMATRSISSERDRLATIMIAPLMTCSARLPVYALLIAAFIPNKLVYGWLSLQGLVLFGLYMSGIVSALLVSLFLKLVRKDKTESIFIFELPTYRIPDVRNVALGLYDRATIFLKRVGGIIVALSILLWFLVTFPLPPDNPTMPPINYSIAGQLGHLIHPIFAPIGFTWEICIALIPAMAAREVIIAALGVIYAMSGDENAVTQTLLSQISGPDGWGLATGMSLLVWFIFAPHCLATLATIRRETGSWKQPTIMAIYLFSLAYLFSFITYQVVSRF